MKSAENSGATQFAHKPAYWPEDFPAPSKKTLHVYKQYEADIRAGRPTMVRANHPALHDKNLPWITNTQLRTAPWVGRIARELVEVETQERKRGRPIVGLAAPQIGYHARIALIRVGEGNQRLLVANPIALPVANEETGVVETNAWSEGCGSLLGLGAEVETPNKVRLIAASIELQDDGSVAISSINQVYEDSDARVIRHEVDHTNGVLYTNHAREQGNDLRHLPIEELPLYGANIRGADNGYEIRTAPWEYHDVLLAGQIVVADCQLR